MAVGGFAERLALIVSADVDGAVRGLKKVGDTAEKELGKGAKGLDKWGSKLQTVGAGLVAFGGVALFGLGKAAKASEGADLAVLKLSNSIQNNKRLAGESADSFVDLAQSIQKKTAADGDAIVAGQAMLGTFKVTGDQLRELTPLVVDYARKFGTDLVTANASVGKALDGSIGALKRNGVSIDENLFKTDRYAAVMQALRSQVGGFAEQEGATFAGSLERMKNRLGDLAEGVGSGAVQAFDRLIGVVDGTLSAFESLSPEAQSLAGEIATYGAVSLIAVGGLSSLIGTLIKARANFGAVADSIRNANLASIASSPVTLAAAGAVGILGIHLFATAKKQAEARRVVELYTDALAKQTGAVEDNINAVTAAEFANSGLADTLNKAGGDLNSFASAVRDGTEDWGAYRDALTRLGPSLTTFRTDNAAAVDALQRAGLASTAFGQELIRLLEAGTITGAGALALTKSTEALSDGLNGAREKSETLKTAQQALGVAEDETTASIDEQTDAHERATKAIDDKRAAVLATIDSDFAYRGAQEQVSDALNDLTVKTDEAARATGTDLVAANEAADDALRSAEGAMLGQAGAAVRLAEDQAKATGSTLTAIQKNAIYRDELIKLAGQFPELAGLLQAYIDKLNAIPTRIHTELAFSVINPDLPRQVGGPTPRAHGGPVSAGRDYWVGENGPELLRMGSQSGTVIPNNQLGSMSAANGGSSQPIVVQLVVDGRVLAETIRRFDKGLK